MNVFLLNGAEDREVSKGKYNQALSDTAKRFFEERSENFVTTVVRDGYDNEDEVTKIENADVIIYQFPIYWFHMPGSMKTYFDDVYMAGRNKIWLNDGRAQGGEYGSGGLMQKKKYMLSTTWNAPEKAFNDPDQLFDGKSVDDALFMFHKMQEFMGASSLPTFACLDIMKHPDIDRDLARFNQHLISVFDNK